MKKQLKSLELAINKGNPDKLEVFYKVYSILCAGDTIRIYQHHCESGKCLDYTSHGDIIQAEKYYSAIGFFTTK